MPCLANGVAELPALATPTLCCAGMFMPTSAMEQIYEGLQGAPDQKQRIVAAALEESLAL